MAKNVKQFIKNTLYKKKGFTLVELIVVIALLIIALSLGAMSLFNWLHHSEFIKNEEYARQTYLTAQTALVNMKSDGGIEELVEKIVQLRDENNSNYAVTTLVGSDAAAYSSFNDATFKDGDDKNIPRIFALIGTGEDYKAYQNLYNGTNYDLNGHTLSPSAKVLYDLIDPYIYDKSMLYNTICVEIDVEEGAKYSKSVNATWAINDRIVLSSAHVHSVFFSTMADEFTYVQQDNDDIHSTISLNAKGNPEDSRDADYRETIMLGYYSVADSGNVTDIASQKLKMKNARLVNDETLDLVFSSTAGGEVEYTINLYSKAMDDESDPVMTAKFVTEGMATKGDMAELKGQLYNLDGTYLSDFDWYFPHSYDGYEHRITLDAMMDAETLNNATADDSYNFSITRILGTNGRIGTAGQKEAKALLASDIYADVTISKATGIGEDANASSNKVETNEASPMFQNTVVDYNNYFVTKCEAGMSKFRHLSNIRYMDNEDEDKGFGNVEVSYILKGTLDWTGNVYPTVVYDIDHNKLNGLKAFPMIPVFQTNWKLSANDGVLKDVGIRNISLNQTSKVTNASVYAGDDANTDQYPQTLALFGINKGKISSLIIASGETIVNATAPADSTISEDASDDEITDYINNVRYADFEPATSISDSQVRAVGLVCGINRGIIENVMVTNDETDMLHRSSVVVASVQYNSSGTGVGQVCGINEKPVSVSDGSKNSIGRAITQGTVKANVSGTAVSRTVNAGIGGVVGYMNVAASDKVYLGYSSDSTITEANREKYGIVNSTDVTGNMNVGGIVGKAVVSGSSVNRSGKPDTTNITNVVNKGLVLCSENAGAYIGGIVGYADGVIISDSNSCPGYSNTSFLTDTSIAEKCNGDYVGGVVGYSNDGEIYNCSTVIDQSGNGFVLGRNNVGGIVGATESSGYIQPEKDDSGKLVQETENGCNVLGINNVGGIIGENTMSVSYCVNSGLVAGYGENVGGIVGYNHNSTGGTNQASVEYCTTKITNDTDNSKYATLVNTWLPTANNVGGIVGYNKGGRVVYDTASNELDGRMNAYVLAVGKNNVGGIIGTNEDYVYNGGETSAYVKLALRDNTSNSDDTITDGEGVTPSNYTSLDGIITGKVYGSGDCVGGIIGLNLSDAVFDESGLDNLASSMYWIEGRYAVGGIIGANIISTNNEVSMSTYAINDNQNAYVKGTGIVGGIVGYNRIVRSQLKYDDSRVKNFMSGGGTGGTATGGLVNRIASTRTFEDVTSGLTTNTTGKFVIKGAYEDSKGNRYTNKTRVYGSSYVSGIIGKNDEQTNLVIKDCVNKGDVTGIQSDLETEIKIKDLLSDFDDAAGDNTTILVGGIVGENTENSVLDNCLNEGNIKNGDDVDANGGISGVAGINKGLIYNCQLGGEIGDISNSYVGGIASINYCKDDTSRTYASDDSTITYTSGTVLDCVTAPAEGHNSLHILGDSNVGGIVALNYKNAVVSGCKISAQIDASNGNDVGGLVGINYGNVLLGSTIGDLDTEDNKTTLTGYDYVGGVVGRNTPFGKIVSEPKLDENGEYTNIRATSDDITITGNMYVGGIVGINEGSVGNELVSDDSFEARIINCAAVTAKAGYAGGIVGYQASNQEITNSDNYGEVIAQLGYAGGITAMNTTYLNSSEALDEENIPKIINCNNYASVSATNGYAGAIAAINYGLIENCKLSTKKNEYSTSTGSAAIEIKSGDVDYAGIITAVNGVKGEDGSGVKGEIRNCSVEKENDDDEIKLTTGSVLIGGVTGYNSEYGVMRNNKVDDIVLDTETMDKSSKRYTVGGVVAVNDGVIYGADVKVDFQGSIDAKSKGLNTSIDSKSNKTQVSVKGFNAVEKIGGIAGVNNGAVIKCKYSGEISIAKSEVGNAYGGIVGENKGYTGDDGESTLTFEIDPDAEDTEDNVNTYVVAKGSVEDCDAENIKLYAPGIVNYNSATVSAQRHTLGASMGGIVGNNDANAFIRNCFVDRNVASKNDTQDSITLAKATSYILMDQGLVGGVAGNNLGLIEDSGTTTYKLLSEGGSYTVTDSDGNEEVLTAEPILVHRYNKTSLSADEDNEPYNDESDDFFIDGFAKLKEATGNGSVLIAADDGNTYIGGIAGYNAKTGEITGCVTGSYWYISLYTGSSDPAIGGIAGWYDSENDTDRAVNMATVVKSQTSGGEKNGSSGGVIGKIWNSDRWTVKNCYNFGKVASNQESSGIDSIRSKRAAGIISQIKYKGGEVVDCHNYGEIRSNSASAGIVAMAYYLSPNEPLNVYMCTNHGKIIYHGNLSSWKDSNSYYAASAGIMAVNAPSGSNNRKINVVQCANYGDVVKDTDGSVSPQLSAGVFGSNNAKDDTVNVIYSRNYAKVGQPIAATTTKIVSKNCVGISSETPVMTEQDSITQDDGFLKKNFTFGESGSAAGNIFIYAGSDRTENDNTIHSYSEFNLPTDTISSNFLANSAMTWSNISPVLYASKYTVDGSTQDDYMYYGLYPYRDYNTANMQSGQSKDKKIDSFNGVEPNGKIETAGKSSLINMIDGSVVFEGNGDSNNILSDVNGKTVYGKATNTAATDTASQYNYLYNIYGSKANNAVQEGNVNVGVNFLNYYRSPNELMDSSLDNISFTGEFYNHKTEANQFALYYYREIFGVDVSGGMLYDETTSSGDGESGEESGSSSSSHTGGSGNSMVTKLKTPYGSANNKQVTYLNSSCTGNAMNVWWLASTVDARASRYEVEYYVYDTEAEANAAYNAGADSLDSSKRVGTVDYYDINISESNPVKFAISDENMGKYFIARAVARAGVAETSKDSAWSMTKPTLIINSLPKPVFRLEYFDSADVSNEGLYYVLENVDEYKECIADDPSLKFCITLASKTTPTTNHKILTQADIANANGEVKTRVKNLSADQTGDIVYSSALLTSTSTRYANSPLYEEMTDYCDVGKVTGGYPATLSDVTLTGTTVSDMTVTYKIKNSNLSRVPKYRVEVVKKTTASDGTEVQRVIQAQTVILSTTATEYKLTNFPSDMFLDDETGTFKGLMLRAWLLESGKGLTYYYHEVTDGHTPAHEPNVVYADYNKLGDESGSLSGKQYYSYALSTTAAVGNNKSGINVCVDIPTVANLEKPVITDGDLKTINNVDMNILEPTFDDKNQMYYTFGWDYADGSPLYANAKYNVEIKGIRNTGNNDGTTNEFDITSKSNISDNQITLSADTWSYDQVKVTVTRIGETVNNVLAVGYSSEKTFDIYRRLQTIAAPSVTFDTESSSGLNYTVKWNARDSVEVCKGYRVYVLCDNESNEIAYVDSTDNNTYSIEYNFEKYTGKRIYIYVVAEPVVREDGVEPNMYKRSQNGNQAIVDVAERAEQPQVEFKKNWSELADDGSDAVSEAEFLEGAISLDANIKAIGNDELYTLNLQGVVFKDKESAQKWIDRLNSATTDEEKIAVAQELVQLNGIDGDADKGELAFGILTMNNGKSNSTDWLKYTQTLTKAYGIGYEHAGYYMLPLVRRITTASAAAYSIWSWDGSTDGYPGVLKLPRIRLDKPSPTISTISAECNGKGIVYRQVDANGDPVDPIEISDITLPLRKHTWLPSETIKADAYDISVLSQTEGVNRLNYRLEYVDGQSATETSEATNGKVVIQPYTVTTASETTQAGTTYGEQIAISDAFASNEAAVSVFGESAVLTLDNVGVLAEDGTRTYTDVITVVPESTEDNEEVEPVEIARREYVGEVSEDTEYTYTYTIPNAQVKIDGVLSSGDYSAYNCVITQSPQIVLKANAEGITEYSIIYAGVNYSSDGEPVKFTVPAVDEDAKGSECSLRSTASNYMELDITAVIKDINNPQYVSSDTNVCYIW